MTNSFQQYGEQHMAHMNPKKLIGVFQSVFQRQQEARIDLDITL